MAGFTDWVREKAATGSNELKRIAELADANAGDWEAMSHRKDPAPLVQFVIDKADAAERDRLIAALAAAFSEWSAPARASLGTIFLALAAAFAGAAIIYGIYSGTLDSLGDADYARGLITFLFATCTIAVILIVVVAIFWVNSAEVDGRFSLAKDVITILIGVLGTILGFYFGSADEDAGTVALSDLSLSDEIVGPSETTTLTGRLTGGTAPYSYDIIFEGTTPPPDAVQDVLSEDGAVNAEVEIPPEVQPPAVIRYTVTAEDSAGREVKETGSIFVASEEGGSPPPAPDGSDEEPAPPADPPADPVQ
jgi:hypothetical protein